MTLPYSVPNFAGIEKLENLSGVDGLSKLKASWIRAGGSVSGYKIYLTTTSGEYDFNHETLDIPGGNSTQATISGLSLNTSYFVVVRAYDTSSGNLAVEQNTFEKSLSTLSIRAPSFSGISTAIPGSGSLGFNTIKASWGSPHTDGVYDGFVVQYEPGTCAQGFSSSPSEQINPNVTDRELTITGLTQQTTYRVRVRSLYTPTGLRDSNTSCQEALTYPPAPQFSGVANVNLVAGISGFNSLSVSWPQASSSFSYYNIEWSASSSFSTTLGSVQLTSQTNLNRTLTDLPRKTIIYVRVSAVYNENGIQMSAGANKVLSAKTEPPSPTGEGISSISILSSDSLRVNWIAPSNAGAVYNQFRLWRSCGSQAANSLLAKLNGPADNTYPASQLFVNFAGLAANTECCYQIRAHYDDGTNNLSSQSTSAHQCKTPTLLPPQFGGIVSVTNSNQPNGFSQLTVGWTPVAASEASLFSYYEIAYATTPNGHNWNAGTVQITDRNVSSKTITGLSWFKAADWGDIDHDGGIDRPFLSGYSGWSVAELESGPPDSTTVRCHTDNTPSLPYFGVYAQGNSSNCRSRYGVSDMVGVVAEWTTGQIFNGIGNDNGVDGLWLGQSFPTSTQSLSNLGTYDLFRGLPKNQGGAPVVTFNSDAYWYANGLMGSHRGGKWSHGESAGRWALILNVSPGSYQSIGGRCRF